MIARICKFVQDARNNANALLLGRFCKRKLNLKDMIGSVYRAQLPDVLLGTHTCTHHAQQDQIKGPAICS